MKAEAVSRETPPKPRILHLSSSDGSGGAARAAYRIHRALVDDGLDSRMRVLNKTEQDDTVETPRWPSRLARMRARVIRRWERHLRGGWFTENPVLHSLGLQSVPLDDLLANSAADVYHLHWLSGLLSIEEIGRLGKPVVWTLHDMWPFCGAEHYAPEEPDARWRLGYRVDNRPPTERGRDLNHLTWERKRRAWQTPMTIVSTSRWLANCARSSLLLRDMPVHLIPYPLDLALWRPIPQAVARAALDLPLDGRLILFGADGGLADPRKGGRELRAALWHLAADDLANARLLIYGQGQPRGQDETGEWSCPVHWLGRIRDDRVLVLAYCAADVMVVPSLQEAFGQSASEALACGTPVVGFEVGGLLDIVEHGRTGYLAPAFDTDGLAHGIAWVLQDADRHAALREASRERAQALFEPQRIAELYRGVYAEVLGGGFRLR